MRLSGRDDTARNTGNGRSRRRPATESQVSYTDLDDEWEASEKEVRDVSRYAGGLSKDRSYENSYIENMEDTRVYNRDRVDAASAGTDGGRSYASRYEDDSDGNRRSYSGRYTESADGSRSQYTGRYEEESGDSQGYRSRYTYEDDKRDSRGYSSRRYEYDEDDKRDSRGYSRRYEYDEYEEDDGRDSSRRGARRNADSSRTSSPSGGRAKTKVKKVKKVKKVVSKDGKGITGKVSGAASRGISSVLRFATALVMLLITMRLAVAFMTGYPLLGTIDAMVAEKNWGLMFYLAGGACLVLLGFISAFWSLTRRTAASDDRIRSYDTGRGLFPFLFFLIVCMAAGLETFLPEGGTLISALRSFLQTLSGAYSKVLPLSVTGVVLCVIRKLLKS